METVFNIFVKKLSVVWFDYLIKEDVQMSSFWLHTSLEALASLVNNIVDYSLIQTIPHFQQALLQIVYIMDCCLVDSLLHNAPHFIVDRI